MKLKPILFLLSILTAAPAQTVPVSFPVNTLFGGAAYNRPLTITAANTLVSDGQNLWAGTYVIVPASVTNPVVNLYPNTYLLTVPGVARPARFTVPGGATNSATPTDVTTLLTSGPLFYFAGSGLANLTAGTNISFITNADGSISVSAAGGGNATVAATAQALAPGEASNLLANAVQAGQIDVALGELDANSLTVAQFLELHGSLDCSLFPETFVDNLGSGFDFDCNSEGINQNGLGILTVRDSLNGGKLTITNGGVVATGPVVAPSFSGNAAGLTNLFAPIPTPNIVWVQTNGNDLTGRPYRQDLPYATLGAVTNIVHPGDTVKVGPGIFMLYPTSPGNQNGPIFPAPIHLLGSGPSTILTNGYLSVTNGSEVGFLNFAGCPYALRNDNGVLYVNDGGNTDPVHLALGLYSFYLHDLCFMYGSRSDCIRSGLNSYGCFTNALIDRCHFESTGDNIMGMVGGILRDFDIWDYAAPGYRTTGATIAIAGQNMVIQNGSISNCLNGIQAIGSATGASTSLTIQNVIINQGTNVLYGPAIQTGVGTLTNITGNVIINGTNFVYPGNGTNAIYPSVSGGTVTWTTANP